MKKNECIKETVIRQKRIESNGNVYDYKLIMRRSNMVTSFRMPLYSVSVGLVTEDGSKTESALNDVFSDPHKAGDFFDKLVDGLATPLNLHYILEDELV